MAYQIKSLFSHRLKCNTLYIVSIIYTQVQNISTQDVAVLRPRLAKEDQIRSNNYRLGVSDKRPFSGRIINNRSWPTIGSSVTYAEHVLGELGWEEHLPIADNYSHVNGV